MRFRTPTRDVLFLAACCVATLGLKLWANAGRVTAVRGDTAYYFHVAKNLYEGRGFVCDYTWSFLENPDGRVPAPSHGWWMPGPSVVSSIGMWVAGEPSYEAAKVAMSILTSLFPVVVWLTAMRCFRDKRLAVRATLLSVAFHPFIDQPAAPLSHGPYGVFVGFALALLAGGPLTSQGGAWLGVLIGAAHYFRGDALTLFATAALVQLGSAWLGRPPGERRLLAAVKPLGIALLTYVAVMSPWFLRNLGVYGRPMPAGPSRAVYMRDYYDWFALPYRLNAEQYFSAGLGPLLTEKVKQTAKCGWSFLASYFDPTLPNYPGTIAAALGSLLEWSAHPQVGPDHSSPPPWLFLRHLSIAMTIWTFGGLLGLAARTGLRREGFRWAGVYTLHALAELVFYAWLFTGVSNQSYVSSLYALYPLFVVGMAAALNPIEMLGIQASTAMRWTFGTIGWTLTVFLVFFNALGVGAYLRAYKGPEYLRIYKEYKDLGVKLRKAGFDPAKDRVMLHNTWDLYDADPLSVVRTPDEPLPRILDTAQKLGVTWILVEDEPDDGTKLALGRPYRAQIYHVYRDKDLFWVAFRNETLRLSAVKIRAK